MDFVSKALGSFSLGLPVTLGQEIAGDPQFPQPWKLYAGTLKKDASPVSVFDYADSNQPAAQLATAALRKLKLPGVVKHIDTFESGQHTYVVTEPVEPLDAAALSEAARKFVLESLLQALGNMHTVARCSHNNITAATLMQSRQTGRFVLVGFEFATFDGAPVQASIGLLTKAPSPNEGWTSPTLDTYQFGVLVRELAPGETRLISALTAPRRPSIAKLASSQSAQTALRNPLTQVVNDVAQAVLMPAHELDKLCRQIDDITDALYPGLIQHTILPELIKTNKPDTFRTNIALIARLVEPLKPEDTIVEYLVQQFASLDRAVRLELLRHLPRYIGVLPAKTVQQSIFPKMAFGFADTEVVVRKASVASIEYMVDKLNSRQLNSELLRLLAKTHSDADPDVRALTTTVLCRLAAKLDNRSVITTALGRALKDPEPKCRRAALRGVTTIDVPVREIAEKLLGPAAGGMLDNDRQVAQEASNVTEYLLRKIRESAKLEAPPGSGELKLDFADSPATSTSSSRVQSRAPSAPPHVPTPLSTLKKAALSSNASLSLAQPADLAEDGESDGFDGAEEPGNGWAWDDEEADESIEVDEDAWGWEQ